MKNVIGRTISNGLKAFTVLAIFLMILLSIQMVATQMLYVRIQKAYPIQPDDSNPTEVEIRQQRIYSSQMKWLPDGMLHLIYVIESDKTGAGIVEIYDVNDNLVWTGPEIKIPYTYLKQADSFYSRSNEGLDFFQNLDPDFSRDLIFPVADAKAEKTEFWRYDFGHYYFTGYNRDKGIIGYCSAAGFANEKDAVVSFEPLRNLSAWIPVSSRSPQAFLLSERRLWQVNFENRRLEKLYESKGATIGRVEMIDWRRLTDTEKDSRPAILVHIQDQPPVLIAKEPDQTLPIQKPESLSGDYFQLYSSGNSFYLAASWIQGAPDPYTDFVRYVKWREESRYQSSTYWQELYRVEADGSLALLSHFEYTRPTNLFLSSQTLQNNKLETMQGYTSLFAPAGFSWIYSAIEQRYKSVYNQSLLGGFCMFIRETHPHAARFYYPISLIFAVIALIHALPRRTGWGRIIVWLVFIFCFNLAGFLTYLSLNHYPVIRCASCGRRRGLNRPDCPACGAALPAPETRDVDLIYPPSGEPVSA